MDLRYAKGGNCFFMGNNEERETMAFLAFLKPIRLATSQLLIKLGKFAENGILPMVSIRMTLYWRQLSIKQEADS